VKTLNESKHKNMKELRYKSEDGSQMWRAAFAFDPNQQAIVLCAGDKQGVPEKAFYKALIAKADKRFDAELKKIKEGRARSEEKANAAAKAQRESAKKTAGKREKRR
jgi:hypothetical protein